MHIAFCYELAGSEEKPVDKMQIGTNFFITMTVVLVGTQLSGRANFQTCPTTAIGHSGRVSAMHGMPEKIWFSHKVVFDENDTRQ